MTLDEENKKLWTLFHKLLMIVHDILYVQKLGKEKHREVLVKKLIGE